MTELIRVPRILWLSFLTTAALFCAASAYPLHGFFQPEPMPFVLAPAFWATAILDAVTSFVLPAMQWKQAARAFAGKVTTERDQAADVLYRELAPEIRVLRADPPLVRRMGMITRTATILSCTLSISVALLGAVLSGLGFWPVWSVPLGFVGVVLVAIRMPTERSMLRPLEKALGAKVLLS